MTYPPYPPAQQPPAYPPQQPQYPPQQQPQYPPQQQPQYPPQQQPQYPPQQPAYPPQQGFYPPPPQAYAPPPPAYYAPPAQPLPRGSLDDFYSQPAASGKSLTFDRKPVGFSYAGVVARTLTDADVQPQTDIRDKTIVLKHPDGRVKFVMVIPLQLQPSMEFPDGRAAWYVKGSDRQELERAMEAAGCKPGTPPEMGAVVTITYTGERPIPGLNPQKMKAITYQRPASAAGNGHQPAAMTEQPAAHSEYAAPSAQSAIHPGQQPYAPPFQQPQYAPAPIPPPEPWNPGMQQLPYVPEYQQGLPAPQYSQPPVQQAPPAPQQQQYAPEYQQAPPAPPQQQAPPPPPEQPQAAAGPGQLTSEQQALLARLTGQPA